jgi:hypothetical protein
MEQKLRAAIEPLKVTQKMIAEGVDKGRDELLDLLKSGESPDAILRRYGVQ